MHTPDKDTLCNVISFLVVKVRSLQEDLELEKISHQNGSDQETTHTEIQRQAARNKGMRDIKTSKTRNPKTGREE